MGNVQDHEESHRGERRQSPELDPHTLPSGACSAFRPVKSTRFRTTAPSGTSKIIRERPFFEDIKIIARGFGEIIEFSNRRGCAGTDHDREPDSALPRGNGGHFSRARLSQDLTKAAAGCRGARRIRKNTARRATIQTAESLFTDKQSDAIEDTKLDQIEGNSITNELKIRPSLNSASAVESDNDTDLRFLEKEIVEPSSGGELSSDLDVDGFRDSEMSSGLMGGDAARAERMRKYKEERRKRQVSQSLDQSSSRLLKVQSTRVSASRAPEPASECKSPGPGPGSSSSRVRTTRASRLRAAASAADSSTPKASDRKSPDPKSHARKLVTIQNEHNLVQKVSNESVPVDSTNGSVRVSGASARDGGGGSVSCAGDDAVISLCDSLSDKITVSSGGVSSRGSSRTRQPAVAATVGPPSLKGPTFKLPARPSSAKDHQDESTARRVRLISPSVGIKSDSDALKDSSPAKCNNSPGGHTASSAASVTRRASPRSFTSPRSSSHSPLSSPSAVKIQQKRRSVELSAKTPSRTSPGTSSNRSSSEKDSVQRNLSDASSSITYKKSGTRSDKLTKSIEDRTSRDLTVDAEQSRIKKRLNPRISDTRQHNGDCEEEKGIKPRKEESKADIMTPGIEKDFRQNIFSPVDVDNKALSNTSSVDSRFCKIDKIRSTNSRLSSRMDALAALTKETLARVDRLTKKKLDSQDKGQSSSLSVTDPKQIAINARSKLNKCNNKEIQSRVENVRSYSAPSTSRGVSEMLSDIDAVTQHLLDFEKQNSNSVYSEPNVTLRKANEPMLSLLSYTPVSILKRKSSQEEHGSSGCSSGAVPTPPVTFSPSVVDPRPSKSRRQGQGILKKRRSLDESQVNRHRSCSPEVAFADDYNLDTRPILKTQRRSSLEEVIRGRSPEGQIQGILKRKCSRDGELLTEDRSLESPEPQGILKRKSNSSSSSSTTSSHVSIAQAVILAAAGGAEIVDEKDAVRPILKKKSFSEDRPSFDTNTVDTPRPILKKKSLTESDDNDHDRPKKPILKSARKISQEDGNASSFDLSEDDRGSRRSSMLKHRTSDGSEGESSVRPILKQRGSSQSREHSESPRPRLSFCSDDERIPQFADDSNLTGQHFINPSLSLLRRLEANSSRASEENDPSRPSRFEAGRLQSPSKLKEFLDSENSPQNQHHFPSVVLRRRDLRPKIVGRSKSLASNFSEELDQILKFRRSHVDENCPEGNVASASSREISPEADKPEPSKAPQRFPSIAERIQSMEKYLGKECSGVGSATGAVPKKQLRQSGRYKTQPVTVDELQYVSRLEGGQVDFQRLAGASSSSASAAPDAADLGKSALDSLPECSGSGVSRTGAEVSALSPDLHPSWISSKFQNYARSPGYGTGSDPSSDPSTNFDFPADSRRQRRYLEGGHLRSPERVKAFENVTASAGSPEYRPISSDFDERSPDHVKSSDNSESVPQFPLCRQNFETPSTPLTPERRDTFANFDTVQHSPEYTHSAFSKDFDDLAHWPQHHGSFDLSSKNPTNAFDSTPDSLRNRAFTNSFSNGHPENRIENSSFEDPKDSPTTREFNRIFKEAAKRTSSNFDSLEFNKLDWDQNSHNNLDSLGSLSDPPAAVSGSFDSALSFGEFVPPKKLDESFDGQVRVKVERPKSLFQNETGYQKGSREATLQELDQLEGELEDVRVALDVDSSALCGVDADHWSLNVSVDSGVFNRMSSGDSGPLSAEELSLPRDFSKQPDTVKELQPLQTLSDETDKSTYRSGTSENQSDVGQDIQKEHQSDQTAMGANCVKKPPSGVISSEQKSDNAVHDEKKEGSPDEPVDSPQQLFGLMKSNSVSARASMWQQLQQQANKAAVKPVLRHSRSKAKDGPSILDRFKTQPITLGEVTDASNDIAPIPLNQSRSSFNLSLEQDEDAKLDENDPAKLTLAEKMKLFGAKVPPRPPMASKKPRSPRFQTMPVLASQVDDAKQLNLKQVENLDSSKVEIVSPKSKVIRLSLPVKREPPFNDEKKKEDVKSLFPDDDGKQKKELGMNFRLAQNKLAEQASRMLTSEVKGILKSRSGAIPLLPLAPDTRFDKLAGDAGMKNTTPAIAKGKNDGEDKSKQTNEKALLTKGESSEGLKDEGIDSSSDEESASGSSHSSDESCSSSESSEESAGEEEAKKSPEPTIVKPSQLKNSRTESDVAKVPRDAPKADGRIKLPCMDEMKARKIMERCMSKSEKDNNVQKTRVPVIQQRKISPEQTKTKPLDPNTIKMKNLKNGSFVYGKSLDTKNLDLTNRTDIKNGTAAVSETSHPFTRKLIPPMSKSHSAHVFQSTLASRLRSGREDKAEGREGSDSDGESSGGREVRRIINKRRAFRGPPSAAPLESGLRRSATQPMAAQAVPQNRGNTIAERLAALQQSGNNEWRKRVARVSPDQDVITATKNKINETLTQQEEKRLELDPVELGGDLLISDRRNKLENSAQGWKKRVGQHDATLFSVAGRMGKDAPSLPSALASSPLAPALITTAQDKKTPQANRFRSRRAEANGLSSGLMKSVSTAAVSQPASPKRPGAGDFKRSISVSGVDGIAAGNAANDSMSKSEGGDINGSQRVGPSVSVPRADDETFTSFFTSASQTVVDSPTSSFIPYNNNNNNNTEQIVEDIDLDAIDSGSRHLLSATGVNRVRATRRAGGSRNPLRALAARTDLRQEYTEPPNTGVADKEAARLKRDKVAVNSPLAIEALAGLASREDFTAINLKKTSGQSPPSGGVRDQEGGCSVLLIHVKGRRRVQVRLVEPTADSVNSGDCFVLVTPDQVFNYNGLYANVIERSRASDIALHIHTTKDLGCVNSTSVITLDEQIKRRTSKQWKQFWNILGVEGDAEDYLPTPAGNADEDEIFESGIISTNMCYEVIDDELVPIQEYWGQTPKISMLDPSKILVFDFGSELYVWNGKITILENRRRAFQLAQELWDEGFDYKDCHICPLNIHQVLGARSEFKEMSQKDIKRPYWTMITKVTQHMETILFKDKFLDWPDFSRVIKVKEEEDSFKGAAEIKPCNVEIMWNRDYEDPSLILEGSHVGRGTLYFDKETMRNFEVKTKSVTKWMIQEYDYLKIGPEDLNEFYSRDSYIVRWEYQITVTGRELNGKPSKHNLTGRDRCAYFCWQGKDASANEKGAAALLTVELDQEKGPQVRVTQSCEPPAFLNLFKGSLIIHHGKKGSDKNRHKLYMVRGNIESESHLVQVACSMRHLRSRASMIIVDSENGQIYVWHGVKSLKHTRSIAVEAAKKMASKKHPDSFDSGILDVKVTEVKEGEEPKSVLDILGGANRELYHSLVSKQNKTDDEVVAVMPRLFHFTDLSGQFDAIEVLSPLRHESLVTPYPFSQQELYSASQPGLYLLDCGDRLWLWQGWWPQQEDSESVETASGTLRWQVCRRAAMETVLEYWKLSRPGVPTAKAYLAVAGLEPLPFTNMFDDWRDRDDVAELSIAYGQKVGEGEVSVSVELCRLSRSSFPLAVLRQRPLPEAVDPAHIERYLTPEDFQETFNMTKEEFYELPAWKQANMKKDLGLF